MTQIIFDNHLSKQLVGESGRISSKPFMTWYVSPLTINSQAFYLFVENCSGLPIITNSLNKNIFTDIFKIVINYLGFLVASQRHKIIKTVTTGIFYHYQPQSSNLLLNRYQQIAVKQPEKLMENINDQPLTKEDLANMSCNLIAAMDRRSQILHHVYYAANDFAPVKVRKPRAGVKYVTTKPRFTDPRHWSSYQGQEISDHLQVVNAIKHNNNQMIKQFQSTQLSGLGLNAAEEKQLLKEYLNQFLLMNTIQVVTTTLASVNAFIWDKITADDESADDDVITLEDFYEFLSTVGIVTKADAQHTIKYIQDDYRLMEMGEETDYEDDMDPDDELSALLRGLEQHSAEVQQLLGGNRLSPDEKQILEALVALSGNSNLQTDGVIEYNGDHLDHTYVIDAKLRNFRPTMSRRFQIGGNLTINQLIVSVLTMFKASFEHPYDLTDDQSQEVYTAPDMVSLLDSPFGSRPLNGAKVMVSSLNKGDHLTLHYDYGDGWAFSIVVKDIKAVKPDKYPKILKGKGYGIIDDIGGVSALRAYRQDYLQHQVNADVKDLLGGELIDLDHFDKAAINHALKSVLDE